MSRPQFSLKTLLWLMLCAACFFGGVHFEQERRRHDEERAAALAAKTALRSLINSEDRRPPILPYMEQQQIRPR